MSRERQTSFPSLKPAVGPLTLPGTRPAFQIPRPGWTPRSTMHRWRPWAHRELNRQAFYAPTGTVGRAAEAGIEGAVGGADPAEKAALSQVATAPRAMDKQAVRDFYAAMRPGADLSRFTPALMRGVD